MKVHKLTALGLFALSILYVVGGWSLKLGTLRNPGSGFLPRIIGFLLLICSGAYVYATFRKTGSPCVCSADVLAADTPAPESVPVAMSVVTAESSPAGDCAPISRDKRLDGKVIGGLAVTVLLFPVVQEYTGFIASSVAVAFSMLTILKYRGIAVNLLVALMLAVICFIFFGLLLEVPLPSGPIEEIIYRMKG